MARTTRWVEGDAGKGWHSGTKAVKGRGAVKGKAYKAAHEVRSGWANNVTRKLKEELNGWDRMKQIGEQKFVQQQDAVKAKAATAGWWDVKPTAGYNETIEVNNPAEANAAQKPAGRPVNGDQTWDANHGTKTVQESPPRNTTPVKPFTPVRARPTGAVKTPRPVTPVTKPVSLKNDTTYGGMNQNYEQGLFAYDPNIGVQETKPKPKDKYDSYGGMDQDYESHLYPTKAGKAVK